MKSFWIVILSLSWIVAGVQAGDSKLACDESDRDARAIERVPPPIPYPALLFCIEGSAEFEFTVGVDGRATNIELRKSQPEGVFGRTGEILKSWKFAPRCRDGEPVEQTDSTTLSFYLKGADHCPEDLPADLLAVQVALVSLYGELNRQTESSSEPLVDLPLESDLAAPYSAVELAHRVKINARLDAERYWRQHPWTLIRAASTPEWLNNFNTAASARDFLELQISKRQPVRQRWPLILEQFRDEIERIGKSHELSEQARELLVENELAGIGQNLKRHAEVVQIENQLYELHLSLIDWLFERKQDWAIEASGVEFASSKLEGDYRNQLQTIQELESRWFEHFELPARIYSSGF